jgi:DNA-binding NarL/FixJ family response regulator
MNTSKKGPVRILVVDDHAVLRTAVRRLLESRSEFEVCGEAADGAEVVEKAAELKPDVVVLDIGMPKMNGFEAARKIKVVSPRSQIVILSSHKDKQFLEQARNVGAVCFVPKSEAERELVDAVKMAAGGESSAVSGTARTKCRPAWALESRVRIRGFLSFLAGPNVPAFNGKQTACLYLC